MDSFSKYLEKEYESFKISLSPSKLDLKEKMHRHVETMLQLREQEKITQIAVEKAKVDNVRMQAILGALNFLLQWQQTSLADRREGEKLEMQRQHFNQELAFKSLIASIESLLKLKDHDLKLKDHDLRQFVAESQDAQGWKKLGLEEERAQLEAKRVEIEDFRAKDQSQQGWKQLQQADRRLEMEDYKAKEQAALAWVQSAQRWKQIGLEERRVGIEEFKAEEQSRLNWAEHETRDFQVHNSEARQDTLADSQVRDAALHRAIEASKHDMECEAKGRRSLFNINQRYIP